jgi:phosphoserine phosphatase
LKTRIIALRHGETVLNVKKRYQGRLDSPLTDRGRHQAEKAAHRLKDAAIDVIYTSPRQRAITTAEIIRGARDCPIITDSRLSEIDCGSWEGVLHREVKEKYPAIFRRWENEPHEHRMPDGESLDEVRKRVASILDEILEKETGKTVMIVSHLVTTMIIMMIFAQEHNKEFWKTKIQGNTSINVIEVDENGYANILRRGDLSHIEQHAD